MGSAKIQSTLDAPHYCSKIARGARILRPVIIWFGSFASNGCTPQWFFAPLNGYQEFCMDHLGSLWLWTFSYEGGSSKRWYVRHALLPLDEINAQPEIELPTIWLYCGDAHERAFINQAVHLENRSARVSSLWRPSWSLIFSGSPWCHGMGGKESPSEDETLNPWKLHFRLLDLNKL